MDAEWVRIVLVIMGFLWTVFGGTHVWAMWKNKAVERTQAATATKGKALSTFQVWLQSCAEGAAEAVYREYVGPWKADKTQGQVATLEEKEKMAHEAMAMALDKLKPTISQYADELGIDIDTVPETVLQAAIVKAVGSLKEAGGYYKKRKDA